MSGSITRRALVTGCKRMIHKNVRSCDSEAVAQVVCVIVGAEHIGRDRRRSEPVADARQVRNHDS